MLSRTFRSVSRSAHVIRVAQAAHTTLKPSPNNASREASIAGPTENGVVIVDNLHFTLEWLLNSPPNVHQFDEPPIIVEIDHLENLVAATPDGH